MADFNKRTATVSRTGIVFKDQKRKGFSEAKTEMIMSQLREMYPDQYVNKYAINKRKDEWAPMISVLGENLELFEQRRKEAHAETDMSEFIPPTTEKVLAPFVESGSQKYYTIFGEGKTEVLFPRPTSLVDVTWSMTYPQEGFDEAFRLNLREGGKTGSITLSPMESRLQRAKVRSAIDRIRKTRPVEYVIRPNEAHQILQELDAMKEKNVTLSFNASSETIGFMAGDKSTTVRTAAIPHGRSRIADEYAVYSRNDLKDAFSSYLATDDASNAMISFDTGRLFTMRYNIIEPTAGYVKYPIREIEAMTKKQQQMARERKSEGSVMIMASHADSSGSGERIPLGSLSTGKGRNKR